MIRKLFTSALALAGLLSLAQIAAAQAPMAGCGTPCPDACPAACPEKVCHRITETKTVTERKYDDVCEEYCRPKCSFFGMFTGSCSSCSEGNCGSVHTKKYLVIHFCKHEECVNKCVVGYAAHGRAPGVRYPGSKLPASDAGDAADAETRRKTAPTDAEITRLNSNGPASTPGDAGLFSLKAASEMVGLLPQGIPPAGFAGGAFTVSARAQWYLV